MTGTGAAATLTVRWKGAVYGRSASFTPTTGNNSRSQLVTNSSGQEGFSIPGGGGVATVGGSFAAASGSNANAYTTLTRTGLTSMCHAGVRSLDVSGTVTLGSAANQGNLGGQGSQAGLSAIPLGDYAGSSKPAAVADFGFSTGTHPTYATEYLDKTDGWAAMDGAADVRPWKGSGYRLVLGVPILPGTGDLATGATGSYDQYFTTLARNLVSDGEANAILRLGWEFNGYWYPWYVQSSTDAANFDKFWQHIVTTMRAVAGEQFKFLWSASASTNTSYTPATAYPGDAYVDYVGTDNYDNFWGSPFTAAAAWSNQLTQQWGLNWLASFAGGPRQAHRHPGVVGRVPRRRTRPRGRPVVHLQHGRLVRRPPRGLHRHLLLRLLRHLPQRHPRRHLPEVAGRVQGRLRLTRRARPRPGAHQRPAPPRSDGSSRGGLPCDR